MKEDKMRYYSHSCLSCFEQCPYRYKLAYIDRVQIDRGQSVACLRGGAAHFAVEMIYQERVAGRTPTLNDLLDATRRWWSENLDDSIIIPEGSGSSEDYLNEALDCVRTYYHQHYPFDGEETLAIEKKIFAPLDDRYGVMGYIDRVVRKDGSVEVHDFKTSSKVGRHETIFENRQLAFYAMGVMHEMRNTDPVALVWHYLPSGRSVRRIHSRGEYEMLKDSVLTLINTLGKFTSFSRRRTPLCNWCDFVRICQPFGVPKLVSEESLCHART